MTAFGEFVAKEDADDLDDLDEERAGGGDCGCRPGEGRTRSLIKLNVYLIFFHSSSHASILIFIA